MSAEKAFDAKELASMRQYIKRASRLPLLSASDKHVTRDLKKIRANKPLSPLLLVRLPELAQVIVADGYHRLCALYALDEDASVSCKIV